MSTNSFIINGKTPINGEWVGADSGVTFPVYSELPQIFSAATSSPSDPANGEVLGQVPDQREAETNRAIDAAAAAFEEWQWSPVKVGGLCRLRHVLAKPPDPTRHPAKVVLPHDRARRGARPIDCGCRCSLTPAHARPWRTESPWPTPEASRPTPLRSSNGEAFCEKPQLTSRFAAEAMRAYGDHIPATIDGVRNVTIKQPIGVVGIITPWNCEWNGLKYALTVSPLCDDHPKSRGGFGGWLHLCHQGSFRDPLLRARSGQGEWRESDRAGLIVARRGGWRAQGCH
jgi:hypothetical protein